MSALRPRLKNLGPWIGLAALLLVVLLYFWQPEFLEMMELKILDTHFRVRGPLPPGGEVVIAAIDEKSLEAFGRWPWPRSRLAELIDFLARARARVITLDIILSEPEENSELRALRSLRAEFSRSGLDRIPGKGPSFSESLRRREAQADHDAQMQAAMANAGNVILPVFFEFDPQRKASAPPEIENILSRHAVSVFTRYGDRQLFRFPRARVVTACIPSLSEQAWGMGHINMMADLDGVVRWELGAIEYQEEYIPSLALKSAAAYLRMGSQDLKIHFGEGMGLGDLRFPTDDHGRMLINYVGPTRTFPYYSIADILQGRISPSVFQDKVVLVGATALGIYDLRVTPFSLYFPGVEKHANTIDNLLHGRFLRSPSWMGLFDLLAVLSFGILLSWLLPRVRLWQGFLIAFACLIGLLGLAHLLFVSGKIWLRVLYPSLALLFCFAGVQSHRFLVEEGEKRRIRSAFQRYVPPAVVDEILSHPDKLKFGGEKRELTVLFSDIRDFTSYSERYPPEQVVEILNEYLTAMVEVIFRHQGTLDKFVGDEIMALYGAPIYYPHHAEAACLSALEMVAELERLHEKWKKEGREGFEIGIGINTGDMVVGNLGSSQLFDYTVIGDNVNLGARLEAINKNYQTRYHIILSESTYQQVRDRAQVRQLDAVKVKGKTRPVMIYELLGMNHARNGTASPGMGAPSSKDKDKEKAP
ncbi:MAG: adenylate/guanylate cyclase domain-containing protein [candidate division NC10 bacterium]|nr:adenylate/guanylate cyclase domain-containing protein [candidate division NC10 bacterium]